MSNPLASIITCTHNRSAMLGQAVSSILAQHYDPVEAIVVDDGSTDDTKTVIGAFGDKVRYYRHENKGVIPTLNVACRQLARGVYIAISDDDDLIAPDRISRLHKALRLFPQAVLAVGDVEMIDASGARTGKRITLDVPGKGDKPILIEDGYKAIMWPRISLATCATLFRRADGERLGWFDEGFQRNADTDFFARLAQLGPLVYVPRVIAYYRRGHKSRWSDDAANNLICEYSNLMLFEKHLKSGYCGREMAERLRERIFYALKRTAYLANLAVAMPAAIRGDYERKGLSSLGMKRRLAYRWYRGVRLPLRSVFKKGGLTAK
ncbi:MAG: glycosyltransferase [Nitrospiraceae bacterium]|nr:glycosyltransferase [Nitrospiraceae bacterium]